MSRQSHSPANNNNKPLLPPSAYLSGCHSSLYGRRRRRRPRPIDVSINEAFAVSVSSDNFHPFSRTNKMREMLEEESVSAKYGGHIRHYFLPTGQRNGPTPNQIELRWNLLIHGSGRNTNQAPIEIGGLPPSLVVHSREGRREGAAI